MRSIVMVVTGANPVDLDSSRRMCIAGTATFF